MGFSLCRRGGGKLFLRKTINWEIREKKSHLILLPRYHKNLRISINTIFSGPKNRTIGGPTVFTTALFQTTENLADHHTCRVESYATKYYCYLWLTPLIHPYGVEGLISLGQGEHRPFQWPRISLVTQGTLQIRI